MKIELVHLEFGGIRVLLVTNWDAKTKRVVGAKLVRVAN